MKHIHTIAKNPTSSWEPIQEQESYVRYFGFHWVSFDYPFQSRILRSLLRPSSRVPFCLALEISNCWTRAGFYISTGRPVPVGIQEESSHVSYRDRIFKTCQAVIRVYNSVIILLKFQVTTFERHGDSFLRGKSLSDSEILTMFSLPGRTD